MDLTKFLLLDHDGDHDGDQAEAGATGPHWLPPSKTSVASIEIIRPNAVDAGKNTFSMCAPTRRNSIFSNSWILEKA
jgi:hypothetical protein